MSIETNKLMNLADGKVLYDDLRDRIEQKYTKASGGIPASDIASGVIPDITGKADKADTVLDTTLSLGRKSGTTVGEKSIALGNNVEASNKYSFAIGSQTIASGISSHSEGTSTTASGGSSHSEGSSTTASGTGAHAEGMGTTATAVGSHAEGMATTASGYVSHAEGLGTTANAVYSHVGGTCNVPDTLFPQWESGTLYHVGDRILRGTAASFGYECIEENSDTTWTSAHWKRVPFTSEEKTLFVVGNGSGANNLSNAMRVDMDGNEYVNGDLYIHCNNDSTGGVTVAPTVDPVFVNSISMDRRANTTVGLGSVAVGMSVEASGSYSHAEGVTTTASQMGTHAEGITSIANQIGAHAEGVQTTSNGAGSHSEGIGTTASDECAHAEGVNTVASGIRSHAEGYYTIANGQHSHVSGSCNVEATLYPDWVAGTSYAVGDRVSYVSNGSRLGLECVTANSDASYNNAKWKNLQYNSDSAVIVGNGISSEDRSNAYTLGWDGTGRFAGDVYVGCDSDSTGGTKLAKLTDIPAVATTAETQAIITEYAGVSA